jgi:hypothetical protein
LDARSGLWIQKKKFGLSLIDDMYFFFFPCRVKFLPENLPQFSHPRGASCQVSVGKYIFFWP